MVRNNSITALVAELTQTTRDAVASLNLTYAAIAAMSIEEIENIPFKGRWASRRISELKVFHYDANLVKDESLVTTSTVASIRKLFATQAHADNLAKVGSDHMVGIHREFLTNDAIDPAIAHCLSRFKGEHLRGAIIGDLGKTLPRYHTLPGAEMSNYKVAKAYRNLASTLLNGLIELGIVELNIKAESFFVHGRITWRNTAYINYPGAKTNIRDVLKGSNLEAGELLSNRIKVREGGRPLKLSGGQKTFLRDAASLPTRMVSITREEYQTWLEGEKWYIHAISPKSKELRVKLDDRIDMYWDAYQSMLGKDIHLSAYFDYRGGRFYYDQTNVFFGPHTKMGKVLYEDATAHHITPEGQQLQINSAVALASGKKVNNAQSDKLWAANRDEYIATLLSTTDKHMSDIVYERRLVQAILDTENGIATPFFLARDCTNGGLQHFCAEFTPVKGMKSCNMGGLKTVQDSHQYMADAFELMRKFVKDNVNQGLFHGSSYKSIAKTLSKLLGKEIPEAVVTAAVDEAYGVELRNIHTINNDGRSMYDSYNSSLLFGTIDGFKAQSIAYVEGVELTVYGLSNVAKNGYTTDKITADMPIEFTHKGEVVHENSKVSGFYANVTHSVDGWSLRELYRAIFPTQYSMTTAHDNFFACANAHVEVIQPQYRANLLVENEYKPYSTALRQAGANHTSNITGFSTLHYGKGTRKMIESSTNYMTA